MDANTFGTILVIIGIVLALAFVTGGVVSLAWVYRDSETRGKTGCMWVLIAFFTWPWGVLAYYLLRDKRVEL
jgi:hypothetical protein